MRLLAKSVVAAMGVAMAVAAVARASRRYAFGYEAGSGCVCCPSRRRVHQIWGDVVTVAVGNFVTDFEGFHQMQQLCCLGYR